VAVVEEHHVSGIASAFINAGYERDEPPVDEAAALTGTEYLAAH
jgi:hypothetical protein